MKRVLIVSATAKRGGAERALATLVRRLPETGWQPRIALLERGALEEWLEGDVICPDDPTILMAARNEVCRNLEAELDATNRPGKLPPGLYEDVADADWLIRVHGHYDGWYTPEMMTDLGFERVSNKDAGAGFRRIYSLWKRVKPAPKHAVDPNRPKRRRGIPAT